MANIIRSTGNTQVVAANATSQLLTFASAGAFLVTAVGNTAFVNIGTANTITAGIANTTASNQSVPVVSNVPQVFSTGQTYNQTPGAVYVAVISAGTGNVYITPVEAS
jgi:hypothetical protein